MGREAKNLKKTGVVTPTLMLGEPGSGAHLSRSVHVESASDAFTAIKSGHIAILPPGSWDMAEATLRLLGASELVVEDRLHTALTGQTLYAV